MPKANLTLLGVGVSLNADGTKMVLASECQLPEADIDAACEALFVTKKPFKLFKNVELAVAASHFGRLKALGIDCEVEVLDDVADDKQKSTVPRNRLLAGVCVLSVALGGGYFLYSQKAEQISQIVSKLSSESSDDSPEKLEIAAALELTEFHQWRNRIDGIERLKYELDHLTSNQLQAYLISSVGDALARTVGTNYVSQLEIQQFDAAGDDSKIQEHRQKLEASLAEIKTDPATFDRFYATLDLAGVYQQIGIYNKARSTFDLAEDIVNTWGVNQAADIVIAEVALAEYQHIYGQTESRDGHLAAATSTADSGFEASPDNLKEWAIAYIARHEAKFGLFTKAHSRLRLISDKQITDSAMVDISNFAASENNEPEFELRDVKGQDFSVTNREMVILLNKTRAGAAKKDKKRKSEL